MKRSRLFVFMIPGFLLSSCFFPLRSFQHSKHPVAPDYSSVNWWASLPTLKDSADLELPGFGVIDKQEDAKVDVFFVHPTTYQYGRLWNAGPENKRVKKFTDKFPVKLQASVFNESCKIYLPYYRGANLYAYVGNKKSAKEAFDLAYSDVKAAFLYYLQNYNHGRPFIIASHSQGTDHCVRLLKEFVDKDTILRRQFIVAYLIGRPLYDTAFKTIKICNSPSAIGGFVSWNSVAWGVNTFYGYKVGKPVCVNPLTWTCDTAYAPATVNKGSLPFTANKIDKAVADAKIGPLGLLWVHRPKRGSKEYPDVNGSYYHLEDYNFFYMSIRENVKLRIEAYFKNKR
jgi:hypothetical protein